MATKPETTLIRSVNNHLLDVYKEKNYNPLRGGTPDMFYSGDIAPMWVEYKWIASIPKKANIKPDLSDLQLRWLVGRSKEGRSVAVIVGCPEGCVVWPHGEWNAGMSPDEFRGRLMTKKEAATWIREKTGVSKHELALQCSADRRTDC